MFLFAEHSDKPLKSLISIAHEENNICLYDFSFDLHCECLVRGRLYMPGQRYELHHKICNLRYGTPGYGMSACYGMDLIGLHRQFAFFNRNCFKFIIEPI